MDSTQLVRDYLDVATPGRIQPERLRAFLADDVSIDDPMMPVEGADAFVAALRSVGDGDGQSSTIQDVVGEGEVVAARILFEMMGQTVRFAQWFWVRDDRIQRIEVVYDTHPFRQLGDTG